MRRSVPHALLALLAAAPGCTDGPAASPAEAIPGTTVRWDPGADLDDPAHFHDVPYPFDLRRDAEGRPGLTGHPRPDDHPASAQLVALLDDARGASRVPVVVFAFDGPPAPSPAPDGPRGGPEDAVWMIDLDAAPDDPRARVPVVVQTPPPDPYTPPNALAVAPVPGFVLTPGHRWAVVVFRDLGDAAGDPLGVPADLVALGRDGAIPDDPATTALLAPVRTRVAALDGDPEALAAVTVFTPEDVVADTDRLTAPRPEEGPLPLDGLAPDPDDGLAHARFCEVHGTLRLPQFQDGEPPFDTGGRFVVDAEGLPIVQREEDVPFAITVPRTAMPEAGFPIVLYAHGSDGLSTQVVDRGPIETVGGEPTPGLGPAHVVARHGFAAAGLSTLLGPERAGPVRDRAYLNLYNLAAYRDTWRQAIADTRRFVDALAAARIDPDVLAGCDGLSVPAGDRVRFDVEGALMGMGQSAGAHLITEVAALEPRFRAVVPTGSGGWWSELLAGGSRVGGPPELIAFALATDVELTALHPGLALLQHAWEPAEPLVHATHLVASPREGHGATHVLLPVSVDDGFFPEPVYEAMALAYDADLAEDEEAWPALRDRLALGGRRTDLPLPATANREGADGPVTAVTTAWVGDGRADSHGVFAQDPRLMHQYGCFFRTALEDGVPTVVAGTAEDAPCR